LLWIFAFWFVVASFGIKGATFLAYTHEVIIL